MICCMLERKKIESVIEEVVTGTDFFLVDLSVDRSNLIRVFIDHPQKVTLDDCAQIHGQIESSLDRDQEDFELQVSSAGLDKPLRDSRQLTKQVGETLNIRLHDGTQFRGILESVENPGHPDQCKLAVQPQKTRKNQAPTMEWIKWADIHIVKIEIVV